MGPSAPVVFDSELLSSLRPATVKSYKAAVRGFMCWVALKGLELHTIDQLDNALVGYMRAAPLTRSTFTILLAAVEATLPQCKRKLLYSQALLRQQARAKPPKHAAAWNCFTLVS